MDGHEGFLHVNGGGGGAGGPRVHFLRIIPEVQEIKLNNRFVNLQFLAKPDGRRHRLNVELDLQSLFGLHVT
jgi:hypothetical protein